MQQSTDHLSQLTFDSLGLAPTLMQGIVDAKFVQATPIQAQTLPTALLGRDIAGQAQTGTGKTAAFLIALYNTLLTKKPERPLPPNAVRAIVLAPTRELAVQIHSDAVVLARHTGLNLALCFGGPCAKAGA